MKCLLLKKTNLWASQEKFAAHPSERGRRSQPHCSLLINTDFQASLSLGQKARPQRAHRTGFRAPSSRPLCDEKPQMIPSQDRLPAYFKKAELRIAAPLSPGSASLRGSSKSASESEWGRRKKKELLDIIQMSSMSWSPPTRKMSLSSPIKKIRPGPRLQEDAELDLDTLTSERGYLQCSWLPHQHSKGVFGAGGDLALFTACWPKLGSSSVRTDWLKHGTIKSKAFGVAC